MLLKYTSGIFIFFCMQALLTWTLPKDAEQPTAVDVAIL